MYGQFRRPSCVRGRADKALRLRISLRMQAADTASRSFGGADSGRVEAFAEVDRIGRSRTAWAQRRSSVAAKGEAFRRNRRLAEVAGG
jgi:hypothetical protein